MNILTRLIDNGALIMLIFNCRQHNIEEATVLKTLDRAAIFRKFRAAHSIFYVSI